MERDGTDDHISDVLRLSRDFRESPDPIRLAELLSAMDDLVWDLLLARRLRSQGDGVARGPDDGGDENE